MRSDQFILKGKIQGEYSGYIFLEYGDVKDSCLVENGEFIFDGKISSTKSAALSTKRRTSAMDKDFYLESGEISINIKIEIKEIKATKLDWIVINSIDGSETARIQEEYESYSAIHNKDEDWLKKKYLKLNEIIEKHPKNPYSGSLLIAETWDSLANTKEIQKMYSKLDLAFQDSLTMTDLRINLFPEKSTLLGKQIIDFELPDEKGELLSTKRFRGNLLLIDFWASWCAPCRKQLPEIGRIYDEYKEHNFKILAVSIDTEKHREDWLRAIIKENAIWHNVNENGDFSGEIVKTYGITSIPYNLLVDEAGKVIANNITTDELRLYLSKRFRGK